MEHFELGIKYLRGDGIECDLVKAAQHFRDAAAAGNPRAKFNLGLMYLKGSGVEYDCDEALKWLREAARAGHHGARLALAQYFSQFDCTGESSVTLDGLHVSIEEENVPPNTATGIGNPPQAAPDSEAVQALAATSRQPLPLNQPHAFFIALLAVLLGTVGLMGAMSWHHQNTLPSEQLRLRAHHDASVPSALNLASEHK